eukprot:COSAG05_NODE_3706_length_1893_cov_1.337235_1_plen_156_part_10
MAEKQVPVVQKNRILKEIEAIHAGREAMEAVGKADKEMAPYTLLHVEGHGEALCISFERRRIGANQHTLYACEAGELRKLALRDLRWRLLALPSEPVAAQAAQAALAVIKASPLLAMAAGLTLFTEAAGTVNVRPEEGGAAVRLEAGPGHKGWTGA